MPIPAAPLRRLDRGAAVALLHRALESLNHPIDQAERDSRSFGPATEALLLEFQTQNDIPTTGVFDADTRAAVEAMLVGIAPFLVYGQLTDASRAPIPGATIVVVDVNLRGIEVPLNEGTKTDSEGEFEVRYAASRFTQAEKTNADLVVRAILDERVLAESAVLFNAPLEVRIDLVSMTFRGPSEYEQLSSELAPLLGVTLERDLVDADVTFLAGKTRRDSAEWRAFVQAHRHAVAHVTPAMAVGQRMPLDLGIPPEAFHGWLRRGLPRELGALWATPTDTLIATLVSAVEQHIVPAYTTSDLDSLKTSIERVKLDIALEAPHPSYASTSLSGLLTTMPVPPNRSQQRAIAAVMTILRPEDPNRNSSWLRW
jgi:Putative peptidoglycan binding domain